MSKKPIYIFGSGGHAKVIADAIKLGTDFDLKAFIVADGEGTSDVVGIPVLTETSFFMNVEEMPLVIIGVGDNYLRSTIAQKIKDTRPDIRFSTVIHPSAIISDTVRLGAGSFVNAGAVINCDTTIKTHVVINTGAVIEHDCNISDFAFIGPKATLAGVVQIGEGAFVAMGSNVIQGLSVGRYTTIAAGATLVDNAKKLSIYMGLPAKKISNRIPSNSML